ncbi:MAG: PHB depolymerase family esterase [Dongiaceae bacterium]
MLAHIPAGLPRGSPLVVLLHGCTQNAASYAVGTGWTTLADRCGFALLLPEQRPANNPNACFSWFRTPDITRGSGEVLSIRCMVGRLLEDHGLDPQRVYVSGLSAGGAMTAAMLATYPEVFAGGAIIAGLPYGCASGVQEALSCMSRASSRPASAWGDLVRGASGHAGPWPRVSVWHGTADATVVPANAVEIVKQWADVHGVPARPSFDGLQDGMPHRAWRDRAGAVVLEWYEIPGLPHGVPIAPRAPSAEQRCGTPAPFILDAGISSTYHIARSWGLAEGIDVRAAAALLPAGAPPGSARDGPGERAGAGAVLRPLALDPGSVIDRALRAAGLLGDKRSP